MEPQMNADPEWNPQITQISDTDVTTDEHRLTQTSNRNSLFVNRHLACGHLATGLLGKRLCSLHFAFCALNSARFARPTVFA
jgi:hypothetical protein